MAMDPRRREKTVAMLGLDPDGQQGPRYQGSWCAGVALFSAAWTRRGSGSRGEKREGTAGTQLEFADPGNGRISG